MKSCLICDSQEYEKVYDFDEVPEFRRILPRKNIVKCKNCSLVYCYPRNLEETMVEVYENDYWHEFQTKVKEKPITERIGEFNSISTERISYIKNIRSSGSLLDVGCSMGFLVKAASEQGFRAVGIDLNQKDIDYGVQNFKINLFKGFLHDHQQKYDVITSYNVIEHVSDPKKMLKDMSLRLNDRGIVVIGTHDIECLSHEKEGVNWKHIVPNEHMYYFSRKTLANLANSVGLEEFYYYKPIDNGFVSFYRESPS